MENRREMKLYGLIEKVWIIDERCYAGNDYSIEMFESKARRDERLLYLNGGKKYKEYESSCPCRFFDGFDIEIDAHSEYNKPIQER